MLGFLFAIFFLATFFTGFFLGALVLVVFFTPRAALALVSVFFFAATLAEGILRLKENKILTITLVFRLMLEGGSYILVYHLC